MEHTILPKEYLLCIDTEKILNGIKRCFRSKGLEVSDLKAISIAKSYLEHIEEDSSIGIESFIDIDL